MPRNRIWIKRAVPSLRFQKTVKLFWQAALLSCIPIEKCVVVLNLDRLLVSHVVITSRPDSLDVIVNSKCWLVAFLIYISLMMDGVNIFSCTHWLIWSCSINVGVCVPLVFLLLLKWYACPPPPPALGVLPGAATPLEVTLHGFRSSPVPSRPLPT